MSVTTLLETLRQAHIELWVEQDKLRFRAPTGALTDELKEQIKASRAEIIDALAGSAQEPERAVVKDPDGAYDPFPLTDIQAAYAVGRSRAYDDGGVGCHGYAEFAVDVRSLGEDPQGRLTAAWAQVLDCHPMLRAVVYAEGWQQIDPTLEVPLRVEPAEKRAAVRAELRHKVYPVLSESRGETSVAPMLDVVLTLGNVADNDAVLHLSVDLLITDFLGLSVILTDFEQALSGRTLQPPSMTFRDYLLTRRSVQQSSPALREHEQARAFWMSKAASLPQPLTLSRDVSDPREASRASRTDEAVRFSRRSHTLSRERRAALEQGCRAAGLTTTAVAVAALGRVLHRYGASDHGMVAMTMLDREPFCDDIARVVGDFTSTVFVEVHGQAGRSLTDLARETQLSIFESLEHKAVAGSELAQLVSEEQSGQRLRAPIVVTSTLGTPTSEVGTFLRPLPEFGISQTPQVLLDVQVSSGSEGELRIDWDSRDGGFASSVLDAAFADLVQLFDVLSEGEIPDTDVLPLRLPPSVTRTDHDSTGSLPLTLHGPVVQQLIEDGSQPAIVGPDISISRGQLLAGARVVSDWISRLPEKPARVAVALPDDATGIAVQLGSLMAGCSYVPLDAHWPSGRIDTIMSTLQEDDTAVLVTGEAEVLSDVQQALQNSSPQRLDEDLTCVGDPDSEAYVIFTSGSTGAPKGVRITHRQACTTLNDLRGRLQLSAADSVLAVSRQSFDLSVFNTFGMLGVGGRIVLAGAEASADPTAWIQAMREHHVTIWNSVPAQLHLVLDELADAPDGVLDEIRVVLVSGDWVPVEQPEMLWRSAPDARFFALGGATEAAIWSVLYEVQAPLPQGARSIPYGRAMGGQGVWVLNDENEPAAPFQEGDIVIGGDGVGAGYLGATPEQDAAFFVHPGSGERCYRTGDRGRLLGDGTIEFLGRQDGQVKIAGHRIELGEVEAALSQCPGVARSVAAVRAEDDMSTGGHLIAAVVPERSDEHANRHRAQAAAFTASIDAADCSFVDGLNADAVRELALLVSDSAMEHMATLIGRFPGADVEAIVQGLNAGTHAGLVARWVDFLVEHGWAERAEGLIRVVRPIEPGADARRWARIWELDAQIGYGHEQLSYVRSSLDELEGLLQGSTDPLALLFPDGGTETAVAAYGENLFARWINNAAATGIVERAKWAKREGRSLRVLEVGGGVGGTTVPVLRALADVVGEELDGVDYLFTDVSHYFFDGIRTQCPSIETALFDLNQEPWDQGIPAAAFDVVLCANVLHNASDVPSALSRLSGLLVPGGSLVVLDSTSANAPLMTSMEFKEGLHGFTDVRAETGRPFLSLREWTDAFDASPFSLDGQWPADAAHVMAVGSQHLMWATNTPDRADLDVEGLRRRLAEQLPRYMVPQSIVSLAAIPLTANGKVDRAAVLRHAARQRVASAQTSVSTVLSPEYEPIAEIWREVLALEPTNELTPASDFFDCGGDSLLLARCVGKLRRDLPGAEDIPWDDIMRRMMANPTLEGCAAAVGVRADGHEQARPNEVGALISLLPADGLEDSVLVVVHDGSGGIGPYQDVIDALANRSPRPAVLGLRRPPGDDYLALDAEQLLETLADRYAQELLELEAHQVHLFGYCMGGLVAAALATRLDEAGRAAASCTVASSYRIPFTVEDELLLDYSLAKLLHHDPRDAGIEVDDVALGQALTRARALNPVSIREGALRDVGTPELARALEAAPATSSERLALLAASSQGQGWSAETLAELRAIFKHSLAAVAAWDAPPHLGDIRFLRQHGDLHFLPTLQDDMSEFWREFCLGQLEVREVEGTHFDCMTGSRAEGIVDILAEGWTS